MIAGSVSFASRLRLSCLSALFLCSTIGLFGPMMIYAANTLEFSFTFRQAFWILLLIFVGAATLGTALLTMLPARGGVSDRAIALVCALGAALWLQGNVMVWRYGFVDGRDIDWGAKALYGWIDTPVWILLLGSAVLFHRHWVKHAPRLGVILLLVQIVATLPFLARMEEEPGFKTYSASIDGQFQFSKGTNVVVLIVDSFPSDVFQEILDADSSSAAAFDGFTYFRNAVGGYPSTYGAIPFILTGQWYENREPFQRFLKQAFLSDGSLPNGLIQHGVRVELYPSTKKTIYFSPETLSNLAPPIGVTTRDVAYLYGLTLFRYVPHFLKSRIHHAREWVVPQKRPPPPARVQAASAPRSPAPAARPTSGSAELFPPAAYQFDDVRFASDMSKTASVGREEPVFKFYHRMGTHAPILLNENMEYGRLPFTRENHRGFARATLRWVTVVLDALRRIGAYDNSLILILGDHGHPQGGLGLRMPIGHPVAPPEGVPEYVVASGLPLVLVKPLGGIGPLRTRDAPVSLGDVPATVFAALGMDRKCKGTPLFDVPETARRTRRFLHYHWTHASWKNEYFPVMTEYEVNGFSWDPSSWRATGQVFAPPREEVRAFRNPAPSAVAPPP